MAGLKLSPCPPWPSNSPDMNIIENVWSYLDCQVRKQPVLPQNTNELWKAWKEEFENIDDIVIKHLNASIPRRVDALLKAHGGNTPY